MWYFTSPQVSVTVTFVPPAHRSSCLNIFVFIYLKITTANEELGFRKAPALWFSKSPRGTPYRSKTPTIKEIIKEGEFPPKVG